MRHREAEETGATMSTDGQIPDDRRAAPENDSATATGEPDVLGPGDRLPADDALSAERLDPELSVAPDTIDLSEPDLAPAEISPEVADAASLEAAAAEARAVAAEAEEASSLVGGPMPRNAPVARASHDGTAPAGAVVEDRPVEDRPVVDGTPVVDRPVEDRPGRVAGSTATARSGTSPASGGGADGSTNQGDDDAATGRPIDAGTRSDARTRAAARPDEEARAPGEDSRTRSSALPLLLVIGAVVVLVGLLIWLVASLISGLGSADAASRDHPAPVSILAHA
ncbi:hypothetical protein [uncultured Arthrobacter sp.]|uniref:hypothetical protein n=1 Tax=uncultured Arthrobacter sp. TaxID=114050 RepID=UPI00260F2AE4|nr:hypothetical protein [uncultured Arthrobacter sp.]